jgi:hypothetical protein
MRSLPNTKLPVKPLSNLSNRVHQPGATHKNGRNKLLTIRQ